MKHHDNSQGYNKCSKPRGPIIGDNYVGQIDNLARPINWKYRDACKTYKPEWREYQQ